MGQNEGNRSRPRPGRLAEATSLLVRAQSGEARLVLDEIPALLTEAERLRLREHAQWLRVARFAAEYNLRELDNAEQTANEIIQLAETFDDRVWRVLGHALHATNLLVHNHVDAGYSELARTVVLLEEIEPTSYAAGHALNATAIALGHLELHELAAHWLDRLRTVAADLEDALLLTLCALNSGWLHLNWAFDLDLLAEPEAARTHYEANLAVFRTAPQGVDVVNRSSWPSEVIVQGCAARAMLGEGTAALLDELQPALETVEATQRFDVVAVGHLALARAHANDGDLDTAVEHAARACDVSDNLPRLRMHSGRAYWEHATLLRRRDGESSAAAAFERFAASLVRSRWDERRARADAFAERLATERVLDEQRRRAAAYLSDPLTGLGNRRLVEIRLPELLVDSEATRQRLVVCFIDLDDFKRVNDDYSHLVGDDVLREFAQDLRASLDASAVTARFGGDEFVAVMPNQAAPSAYARLDDLRQRVAGRSWPGLPADVRVTMSAGLTESWPSATRTQLLAAADEALLRAKRQGKNRVEVRAHPLSEPSPAAVS